MDRFKNKTNQTLAITICLALLLKTIWFFFRHPSFFLFWDYLGHIQEAMKISWPWVGGWSNTYWGGYPTLLYPPLSHWFLKGLLIITDLSPKSLAIFIIFSQILFLHSLWIFTKKHLTKSNLQIVAFSLGILLYLLSPVNTLVSLKGVLFSGTITASFALPLLLYFLSSEKWYLKGFWLGFLLLTHALTASLAFLYLGLELVFLLFSADENKVINVKEWFYSLLLGIFIGLPWILPFLDDRFQHTSFNITGKIFPWGIACLVLLTLSLITQLLARKKPSKLFIFISLIGLLSILPLWISKMIEKYLIRGIHFYRYYSFLVILTPSAILSSNNKFSKKIVNLLDQKASAYIATTITILAALFVGLSSLTYHLETDWEIIPDQVSGRVIDTASKEDIDLFPRTIDHLLTQNTNLVGSLGLFFESSHTGLIYATAKYLLNESSYSVPVYLLYMDELAGKVDHTEDLLNLLGINYQAFTSEDASIEGAITFAKIDIKRKSKNFHHQRYYHLKKISNTKLVETLPYLVAVNPDLDLWDWWSEDDKKITARQELELPNEIDLSQPKVNQISITDDTIKFFVDSDQPAPVYIKFSHSSYWVARALDESGFTTQPIWVTPGNMVVYAAGEVELNWQTPHYLKLFSPLSMIVFTTTIIILIAQKIKRKE